MHKRKTYFNWIPNRSGSHNWKNNADFLNEWYEKITSLLLELMKDTAKLCKETISVTETEIKILERHRYSKHRSGRVREITSTIKIHHDQTAWRLEKRKKIYAETWYGIHVFFHEKVNNKKVMLDWFKKLMKFTTSGHTLITVLLVEVSIPV